LEVNIVTLSNKALSRTASIVLAVIIVVAAVAAGFYAISTVPPASTNTISAQLTDVTFGFAGPADITDTPGLMFWQTFATQQGLNVHTQYFDGDAQVAQALVSGSLQVAEGGFQSTLLADLAAGNSSGSYPFLVFASYETTNDYAFVVSNSIQNWSDLAGKPVATSGPGSSSNLFCTQLLLEHGLTKDQINCAPIGGGGSRIRALLAGKVVGDIAEPFAVVSAVVTGKFHIIATIPQQFPNLLFSVLYTSRAYATAHPDVVTKITAAIILADRWAQNQTAWLAKEQAAFPDTDAKVAATSWKIWLAMNLWDPHGGLSEEKIRYSESYLVNISAVSAYLAPQYWADLSYQTTALQNIGAWTGPPGGYPNPSIPTVNVTVPGFAGIIRGNINASPSTAVTPPLIISTETQSARRFDLQ